MDDPPFAKLKPVAMGPCARAQLRTRQGRRQAAIDADDLPARKPREKPHFHGWRIALAWHDIRFASSRMFSWISGASDGRSRTIYSKIRAGTSPPHSRSPRGL